MNAFSRIFLSLCTALLFACCSAPVSRVDSLPPIWPDYTDVTIPAGIAPMDFDIILDGAKQVYVLVEGGKGGSLKVRGREGTRFPIRRWHALTERNTGSDLNFTVAVKTSEGWLQYDDFKMHVSPYPLEDYGLVYRKFAPGYETTSRVGNYQRNIHNFHEEAIIENTAVPGQCIGCHSSNQADPASFTFHLRGSKGCTLIQQDGKRDWVVTKTDSTISNAVYSHWHPSGKFCAFSTNKISQLFWTGMHSYIEVYDSMSDIVVLDTKNYSLLHSPLLQTKDFETYPAFSADGRTLYYCSAKERKMPDQANLLRYDLCSISFDPAQRSFGSSVDTLINADAVGKSVTFPRPSFDGRFLMFTLADFGNFPINHPEADLWLMDLRSGGLRPIKEVNSPDTESFHNWSSGSHWFLFTSRRDNRLYSNIYISCIDDSGHATKPFIVPQRHPRKFYTETLKTYNVPEWTKHKIEFDAIAAAREVYSGERIHATETDGTTGASITK